MIIRTATIDDAANIYFLEEQVYELHLKERPDLIDSSKRLNSYRFIERTLKSGKGKIFVAEEEDAIIGFCTAAIIEIRNDSMFYDMKKIEIDDFCIDERHRRKGIGKKLFEEVVALAKEIDAQFIELSVWGFNQNAIAFYEQLGMTTRIKRMELKIEKQL